MPKYRVTMEDKIYYEIEVEANSESEAEIIALESVDEAEIISSPYAEILNVEELK